MNSFRPRVSAQRSLLHRLYRRRRGALQCRPSERRIDSSIECSIECRSVAIGHGFGQRFSRGNNNERYHRAHEVHTRYAYHRDIMSATAGFAPTLIWAVANEPRPAAFITPEPLGQPLAECFSRQQLSRSDQTKCTIWGWTTCPLDKFEVRRGATRTIFILPEVGS